MAAEWWAKPPPYLDDLGQRVWRAAVLAAMEALAERMRRKGIFLHPLSEGDLLHGELYPELDRRNRRWLGLPEATSGEPG